MKNRLIYNQLVAAIAKKPRKEKELRNTFEQANNDKLTEEEFINGTLSPLWLGIKNDYRTLVDLESVNVVENQKKMKRREAMNSLLSSRLYDQDTFYKAFEKDLERARHSVLIESPFITTKRFEYLLPILRKLRARDVRVIVNTRSPEEHVGEHSYQTIEAVNEMLRLGVTVLVTGKLHRKTAIIDNEILWEGSLNILSQSDSCEIMRRIKSRELASRLIVFIKMHQILPLGHFHCNSAIGLGIYTLFNRRSL